MGTPGTRLQHQDYETFKADITDKITESLANAIKSSDWQLVAPNVNILTTYNSKPLSGISITGTGTLVLIGNDVGGTEYNMGTVDADPITVLPIKPLKIKTGSTATVYAHYGA